jgi:hypothetical protein
MLATGEEAVTMTDDAPDVVTKDHLRAELGEVNVKLARLEVSIADLRTEVHGGLGTGRAQLHEGLAGLRTELHEGLAGLRTELHEGLAGLRTELRGEIGALGTELRGEIGGLRTAVDGRFDRLADDRKVERRWAVTAAISVLALLVALLGVAVTGLIALLRG